MNTKYVWYLLMAFCTTWTGFVLVSAPHSSYTDTHINRNYWSVFSQLKHAGRNERAPGIETKSETDPTPVGQIKPVVDNKAEMPQSRTTVFTHIKQGNIGKRIQLYHLLSASADKAILFKSDEIIVATQDQLLPEAGRVLGLHRHDNEWVLVTTDGYIDVWRRR